MGYTAYMRSNLGSTSFRQIVSFPPETIRKFGHNVSEMKKLAGRDWEDILQVSFHILYALGRSNFTHIVLYTLF